MNSKAQSISQEQRDILDGLTQDNKSINPNISMIIVAQNFLKKLPSWRSIIRQELSSLFYKNMLRILLTIFKKAPS